ncbi:MULTISPECIES: hypothetical protein [unclassified Bradyrhizobium]|uniref:hypothetical protein n=2 Tax=unclassified Bradyrhizobium TaxID=2631580 RepID=UPI003396B040
MVSPPSAMRTMMSPFLGGRHASVCALDHVELRQNGAEGLPELVQHRSGGIHVNCALIHAPIGSMPNATRKHLLAHRPHADLIENPAKTWLFRRALMPAIFAIRRFAAVGHKSCLHRRFGHTVRETGCGNDRGAKNNNWGETAPCPSCP